MDTTGSIHKLERSRLSSSRAEAADGSLHQTSSRSGRLGLDDDDDEKTLVRDNRQHHHHHSKDSQRVIPLARIEQLPSYSSERFYLLSELEHHARCWHFFSEQQRQVKTDDESPSSSCHRHEKYWCLYLFWKPDFQSSPDDYIRTVIRPALQRLESNQVYLVIDRLVLPLDDNNASCTTGGAQGQHHNSTDTTLSSSSSAFSQAETEAELLVQQVARDLITATTTAHVVQGIVVCLSNHHRAAPGLEVCYEAVTGHARERHSYNSNNYSSSARSPIGVACLDANDVLGHRAGGQNNDDDDEEEQEADAAENVHQVRISSEMSYKEFAQRAHSVWQKQANVQSKRGSSGSMDEDTVNRMVVMLLLVYLLFHTRSVWWNFLF